MLLLEANGRGMGRVTKSQKNVGLPRSLRAFCRFEDASSYNQSLVGLDTSRVTNMSWMCASQ